MAAMDYHHSLPRTRPSAYRTFSSTGSSYSPHSSMGSRHRSQLSQEITPENRETTHIASEFLRNALERERASRRTPLEQNDRIVHSSPIRAATADPSRRSRHHRGDSFSVNEQHGSMGAKEASETISRLNNENFNLKVEVYHRRERQLALEERIQELETEIIERDDMAANLRAEIAAKDTEIKTQTAAVQEAVNVIMDLEVKLEKLSRGQIGDEDELMAPATPTLTNRGPSRMEDEITTLARMPSFVSDISAGTQNLRNVYLNNQGSLSNLVRGDASDARAPSYTPSLSILDEIYGSPKPPHFEPSIRERTPALESSARKTKEEKRQAIEKALADVPFSHRQGRLEKRESLIPVLTGMPISRDILPPTPDTMTSSTLNRDRSSKDTLAHQSSIPENPEEHPMQYPSFSNPSAAPSVTAFNDRRGLEPITRPKSASEADTASRWDTSDTESLESDVDIWLRERGRASPELFSFPSTGPKWDSDQMFGLANAMSSVTKKPAPPPPNRRSSLQARTSTLGRPRTRGTPSVIRSEHAERCSDYFDARNGATPPPIQLKKFQVDTIAQPDDGGVSLKSSHHSTHSSTTIPRPPSSLNHSLPGSTSTSTAPYGTPKTPQTPTTPITPNSTGSKRRWFGLGRRGSIRKG